MGEARALQKVPYALGIEVRARPPMNSAPDIVVRAPRELSYAPKTEVRALGIEVRARPPMNSAPDIEVRALRKLSCAPETEVRALHELSCARAQ